MKLSEFAAGLCALGGCVLLSAGNVTLAWDPNVEPEVAGYKLYYGLASGQHDQVLDAGNATTLSVAGLTPGVTYWFVVTAYTAHGLESDPSNEVSYTPPFPPPTATVLLSFDVECPSSGPAVATWQTGVEMDLILFRLERQITSGNWVPVPSGTIPARGSSQAEAYRVEDPDAPVGSSLAYRLMGVDTRGRSSVLGETAAQPAAWPLTIQDLQETLLISAPATPATASLILETTTDLHLGPWTPVGTLQPDPTGSVSARLPALSTEPQRFFRARRE